MYSNSFKNNTLKISDFQICISVPLTPDFMENIFTTKKNNRVRPYDLFVRNNFT